MTNLAQAISASPSGLADSPPPLSPHLCPRSLEQVRFQVISDYLHDLRTPLVALRGYSRMVLEEHAGSLNSTQKDYLRIVMENTSRVVRVLNELAQVATLEPLSFGLLDARELAQELLVLWRPRVLSRSIQLREVLPAECCFLWGDRQRLAGAFEEFFSGVAGSAEREAEIVVEMSRSGENVCVRIFAASAESGSKAARDPLPPGTACPAPQAPRDPNGGFSLAESIIRLHGGHLEARSDPASRASLSIVLPACSGSEIQEREFQQ